MDLYVNFITAGKSVCFGAPYICAQDKDECCNCDSRMQCADIATQMVHAVATEELVLEGVTDEARQFANSVSNFLPEEHQLPQGRQCLPTLELIKYCYGRSKHLITTPKTSKQIDAELDDLLMLYGDPRPDSSDMAQAISPQLAPKVESELTEDATNTSLSICAENSSDVMPSAIDKADILPNTTIRLPIDAWAKHQQIMADLPDEILAERIKLLSIQPASEGFGLIPYDEIREEFCALNIETNRRRRLAPRFRGMRSSYDLANNIKEELLLRDRIVIDLHWLYCSDHRNKIALPASIDPGLAGLLYSPEFDWEAAWRFASLNKKMNTRAGWLNLDDDLAWQLATIESEKMNKRFYTIMNGEKRKGERKQIGYHEVLASLKSNLTTRLKYRAETWAMIWVCDRLLRSENKKHSWPRVAQLHALATGREAPLERTNIRDQFNSCMKILGRRGGMEETT
ncbi:MAG: hypothetical protein PHH47_08675 [Gallionella sp.]|nr:hypothetical protein [Gallionella sp.]MDD4945880.1 hypothetical protein [Gallionella sp.]MDD5612081.1 hypothetical protein [Gallionella sp.]